LIGRLDNYGGSQIAKIWTGLKVMNTRRYKAGKNRHARRPRPLSFESLQARLPFSASPWHNAALPEDVNNDAKVSPLDALAVINFLHTNPSSSSPSRPSSEGEGGSFQYPDVDNDGTISPLDVLGVVDLINTNAPPPQIPLVSGEDDSFLPLDAVLQSDEVSKLLQRASMATPSNDAIIAIVDRAGQILGVRGSICSRSNTKVAIARPILVSMASKVSEGTMFLSLDVSM